MLFTHLALVATVQRVMQHTELKGSLDNNFNEVPLNLKWINTFASFINVYSKTPFSQIHSNQSSSLE